jgi:phage terminase small subunit
MGQKSAKRAEIFAREYVIDLNGTRAAIAAGYSEHTANEQASRLLAKASTRKLVDQHLARRASRLDLKADKIAEELQRIAFSNMLDYVQPEEGQLRPDFSTLTRDQAAAIQEIRVDTTGGTGDGERKQIVRTTFKLADKRGALELLGRHVGMFQDKLEVTGLEGLADRLNQARAKKHANS